MVNNKRGKISKESGFQVGVNGIVMGLVIAAVGVLLIWGWLKNMGLTASYWLEDESGRSLVSEKVDRNFEVLSLHRLKSVYHRYWQISEHGFPVAEVTPVVEWNGWIKIDKTVQARLVGNQKSWWSVGDNKFQSGEVVELEAGIWPVVIKYEYEDESDKLVVEKVDMRDGSAELISRLWFYPDKNSVQTRRNLEVGVAGAAGLMVIWGWRKREIGKRIVKKGKKVEVYALMAVLVVITGLGLRLYQHDVFPPLHETEDEQGLAWHGISLITRLEPTSWLFYDYFEPKALYPANRLQQVSWFGAGFTLGTPYFDNPPFMPLLIGVVSVVAGARDIFESKLWVIRLIPIAASGLNIYLIYLFGKKVLKNELAGVLGGFFYATTPLIVVANRLVKEENLLATFFLLTGLSISEYIESKKMRGLWMSVWWSGLALLTKETSLVVVPVIVVMLWRAGFSFRIVGKYLAGLSIFGLIYFSYGLPWGFEYVWMSFSVNANKTLDAVSWLRLLGNRYGAAINQFGHFYYLVMLLITLAVSRRLKQYAQLLISTYLIALGALVYGTDWGFFGWYKTALYPFLALGVGVAATSLIAGRKKERENYLLRFGLVLMTWIVGSYYGLTVMGLETNKLVLYALSGLGLVYVLVPELDRRINSMLSWMLIVSFGVMSVLTIFNQEQLYFMALKI